MSSLIDQGRRHHNAGQLDLAEQCYLDAVAASPTNAEALKLLAVLAAERGQTDDALAYAQAAISAKPAVAEYRYLLGRVHAAAGQFDEAVTALKAAAEKAARPDDAAILCDLGLCYESLTRWAEAQASFAEVLQRLPKHPAALHGMARTARAQGDLLAAKSYYEQVLAADPANAHARDELTQVLVALAQS